MQYEQVQNLKKKESQEDIAVIKDHLRRINKKFDEGNNRSLENHVALQSPNEVKNFMQIKELILKVFLLLDQNSKIEKIKAAQKEPLMFIQNKISELLKSQNELDALLYLNMYQAILNNDTTGALKLYDKLKNNVDEDDFEFLMEDAAKNE